MSSRYFVTNNGPEDLKIWLEPFCERYTVPPNARLTLLYEASDQMEIELEATPAQLTLYLDANMAPDALLNGVAIGPDLE